MRQKVESELLTNILPFWLKHTIDEEYGGFRGQITNDLTIDRQAAKGLILNARILWTFSKAFSVYRDPIYLATARRAYEYLLRYFWDAEFGGLYWMVDYQGRPIDTKKRIYGQAFTVYALAEYFHATGDAEALDKAMRVFERVEAVSHDAEHGGYFETYERDWSLAQDQRLSDVDMDEKKSMNTHLHLLEAYATLLRIHEDETVRVRLGELIELFLDRIIDPATHHFILFFDEEWRPRSNRISFGHDIEGSWLLCEAAEILGDAGLLKRVREAAVKMAAAVVEQGLDSDGGLLYEADPTGIIDTDKHWWPQAEAVVGLLNAYGLTDQLRFFDAAERSWSFIEKFIVDHKHGEWFWLVSKDGVPDPKQDKVGPWKCPYHNSRACFEVMERLDTTREPQPLVISKQVML
ncbi:MAG: AGE family epimerase/isomerase [Terracidiphilus sp.]|jgi:mannobiose 2-epimerase